MTQLLQYGGRMPLLGTGRMWLEMMIEQIFLPVANR